MLQVIAYLSKVGYSKPKKYHAICQRGSNGTAVGKCVHARASVALPPQLRHFAQKRLTTTVEEDSSNREYYDEVKVCLTVVE